MLDLTQADLASQVNCSLSMLRKIEQDERRPSAQLAELLADQLAIETAYRPQFLQMARGQFTPDLPEPAGVLVESDAKQEPSTQQTVAGNPFLISTGAVLLIAFLLLWLNPLREIAGESGAEAGEQAPDQPAFVLTPDRKSAMTETLAGTTVTIEVPFGANELELFEQSMRPFEERTGVNVEIRGIPQAFEAYIADVASVGNPPDIASFPQPGYLADFARQGKLVALDTFLESAYLQQQYTAPFLELGTVDGRFYGAPHLATLKGLVWYPRQAFESAGYAVPHTWDELIALTEQIAADGRTPWCIGIEDGDASGWAGTDWVEALLLRTAPTDVYDAWTQGILPFDSSEIRRGFDLMAAIWLDGEYVHGGADSILETPTFGAPAPMFENPPGCFLSNGATFSPGVFPQNAVFGKDYDFFVLPAVDPRYGEPLLGAGNLYAMFDDRPEVREVMRYLTTGESIKVFAETGKFVSAHRDVPLEWYATPRQLRYAQLIAEADVYRFDGSDLMPGEVGFQFWQGIVDWVEGGDLDLILQEIDESWPDDHS